MIRIGLPKGNIIEYSYDVIKRLLQTEINRDILHYESGDIHIYLLKQQDIPKLVHDGFLDVGITSSEWITEKAYPLSKIKILSWYTGNISLLSPKTNSVLQKSQPFTCIARYPHIAKEFFQSKGVTHVKIDPISGSSEGLVPTLFDCAVDCVETGKTIDMHNLIEEAVIMKSIFIVIVKDGQNTLQLQPILKELDTI